jgi:hypothetical protein
MEELGAVQCLARAVYRGAAPSMPEPSGPVKLDRRLEGEGESTLRVAFMVEGKPDLRVVSVDSPLHSIIQVDRCVLDSL